MLLTVTLLQAETMAMLLTVTLLQAETMAMLLTATLLQAEIMAMLLTATLLQAETTAMLLTAMLLQAETMAPSTGNLLYLKAELLIEPMHQVARPDVRPHIQEVLPIPVALTATLIAVILVPALTAPAEALIQDLLVRAVLPLVGLLAATHVAAEVLQPEGKFPTIQYVPHNYLRLNL